MEEIIVSNSQYYLSKTNKVIAYNKNKLYYSRGDNVFIELLAGDVKIINEDNNPLTVITPLFTNNTKIIISINTIHIVKNTKDIEEYTLTTNNYYGKYYRINTHINVLTDIFSHGEEYYIVLSSKYYDKMSVCKAIKQKNTLHITNLYKSLTHIRHKIGGSYEVHFNKNHYIYHGKTTFVMTDNKAMLDSVNEYIDKKYIVLLGLNNKETMIDL